MKTSCETYHYSEFDKKVHNVTMSGFSLLSELRTNLFMDQIVDIVEAAAHILGTADANMAISVVLTHVPRSTIMWTVL